MIIIFNNQVKKENEDRMETEDSTVTTTENEGETYNYPASDLLRNDVCFK